jgi:hypothetical protein
MSQRRSFILTQLTGMSIAAVILVGTMLGCIPFIIIRWLQINLKIW